MESIFPGYGTALSTEYHRTYLSASSRTARGGEKELRLNPKVEETFERSIDKRAFDDENLYPDIHYEGASTGKHLRTFA